MIGEKTEEGLDIGEWRIHCEELEEENKQLKAELNARNNTEKVNFRDFQDERVWIEPKDHEANGYGRWVCNSELIHMIQHKPNL